MKYINNKVVLLVTVLIILIISAYFFLSTHQSTYINKKYRYSVQIPSQYTVNTYNPDEWSIVGTNIILSMRFDNQHQYKQSFVDFVSSPNQINCNADSEDISSTCTGIIQINPFINGNRLNGYEYFINQILTYHRTNKTVNNKWGPLYAFDVSSLTNYDQRALIIEPGFGSGSTNVNIELLKKIVNSLRFTQ